MLSKNHDNNKPKCNCRSKPKCPVNGEFLTQYLVYKGTSATSNNSFVYYGTSEREFEIRQNNRTKSFKQRECMNETELSKYMWDLKDHGFDKNLSWEITKRPHHIPMWFKNAIYVCQKKFALFVPIQTLY